MTQVVSLHDFRGAPLPPDVARIDRRTRWGNPFRIGHQVETRASAVACYRVWLRSRLDADPDFLEPLRGKRLACWCAPLACHGDVIAEHLDASTVPQVARIISAE